jgi:hypothetical protein
MVVVGLPSATKSVRTPQRQHSAKTSYLGAQGSLAPQLSTAQKQTGIFLIKK